MPGGERPDMDEAELSTHLSRISTVWSVVRHAHQASTDSAIAARNGLMERYHGAAYRYLLRILGDPDAADEVFQEFAMRFVRGDFRRADPGRGRFRQYVKSALINLVIDYRKARARGSPALDDLKLEPAVDAPQPGKVDEEFVVSWRHELLSRAWVSLEQIERDRGQPFHAVLRFKSQNPHVKSAEMASRLSAELQPRRPWTEAGIRKLLQRARERFSEILLQEVSRSLEDPTPERLEEELIELGLFTYCHSALERRRR
jgi:RNA polymerase sigma factor (sigma-70 family)